MSTLSAYRKLQSNNPQTVACDLRLLSQLQPTNPNIAEWQLMPRRHAADILFALLQTTSAEDVEKNRQLILTDSSTPSNAVTPAETTFPVPAPRPKHGMQKEEEYPNIKWGDLDDEDVRDAVVLYNDRIQTWRRMKELDAVLDNAPTTADITEMAELRIRNLQAFAELRSLNDRGKYLFQHPLLLNRGEYKRLKRLFALDGEEFLRQHRCVLDNIRRYRSYLKRADRAERRDKDSELLERHLGRERLFRTIMEQAG